MKKIRIGIGMDCSSKYLQCSLSKKTLHQLKELSNKKFVNNETGYNKIEEWMLAHIAELNEVEVVLLVEVTGVYHEEVLAYFHRKGYHISVMMPSRVKSYFKYKGYESKTDKEDARGLSMMICEQKVAKWEPLNHVILEIRTLQRVRKMLVQDKIRTANRLHALKRSTVKSTYAKSRLAMSINQLEKQIKNIEKKVELLVREDAEMARKIKEIESSVTGLGFRSIVTVIAETGGFEYFSSIKQLESYAGFNVVENKSGKYEGKSKISKKGNRYLRTALYMPSTTVVRCKSQPFYGLYCRVNERHGWKIKGKGLVPIQRKLLGLIYVLWKKGEQFDLKYYEKKAKNIPALEPVCAG